MLLRTGCCLLRLLLCAARWGGFWGAAELMLWSRNLSVAEVAQVNTYFSEGC